MGTQPKPPGDGGDVSSLQKPPHTKAALISAPAWECIATSPRLPPPPAYCPLTVCTHVHYTTAALEDSPPPPPHNPTSNVASFDLTASLSTRIPAQPLYTCLGTPAVRWYSLHTPTTASPCSDWRPQCVRRHSPLQNFACRILTTANYVAGLNQKIDAPQSTAAEQPDQGRCR